MANFFKSLFRTKEAHTENSKDKSEKKNFEILKFDGLRAQRMRRTDYAIQCFVKALEIEEDFETMTYLAQAYIATHALDEAHELLDKMVTLEPEFVNTYLTLANVCYMQEAYPDMERAAQKATELDKENPVAFHLLAKAHQGLANDIMTIAHLTTAIALQHDFMEALLMRAEVLLKMQQHEEALKDIEAVLALDEEEETALLLRGKLKQATQDEEGAEADFKKVIALNPFNEQAYIYLARLYTTQQKTAQAIELLDETIELNPQSAIAFHERGKAKLALGDKEGSIEDMKQALELNPEEGKNLNGQFNNQVIEETNSLGLRL